MNIKFITYYELKNCFSKIIQTIQGFSASERRTNVEMKKSVPIKSQRDISLQHKGRKGICFEIKRFLADESNFLVNISS